MTRPTLDRLSLQDLDDLLVSLDALKRAGDVVVELGMVPVFCAMPGQPIAMTLDEVMPPIDQQLGIDLSSQPDETATYIVTGAADGPLTFTEITDPAPGPAVEAAAVDPAQDSGGGDVQIPAAATLVETIEMPEPLAAGAEYEGMAAAQPDTGAAATAVARPAAWTPEEDEKLVSLVALGIVGGKVKQQAVVTAAHELGRPFEGTRFRLHTKLADRLTAKIESLRTDAVSRLIDTHQPDPQPPVPTVPAVEPASGAPSSPAPDAPVDMAAQADPSPIEAHLLGLPRKGGWTMERDHELLELICAGWAMPEISAEMSIPAGDLKARFDLLSGLHRNADDKLVRRWSRDELLAALTPWVKSQAAE